MHNIVSIQPLKFVFRVLYTFFNIPYFVLKIGPNLRKFCDIYNLIIGKNVNVTVMCPLILLPLIYIYIYMCDWGYQRLGGLYMVKYHSLKSVVICFFNCGVKRPKKKRKLKVTIHIFSS